VNPLAAPHRHSLLAAQGWFELGNSLEAAAELDTIPTALRAHPDVLEVRWQIYAKAGRWEACLDIGSALVKLAPDRPLSWLRRSVALHGLKRFNEAEELLMPAVERFPADWQVRYDLACYACLLGDNNRAREWLKQAFALGGNNRVRLMALNDPDLESLWASIGTI
jgi:tetratricopeptide (TPR) repeat protein